MRLERASSEFQNSAVGRATWASRPIFSEKGNPRVESAQSDHDSTPGGSLPSFYQKILETRSREDLLDQRFREINRWIEELRHAPTAYGEDICTDPPFSQMIMQEPIPSNFKLPQFDSYDRTLDLVDHLEAFPTMMLLHGVPDAILCQAFPSTLKGVARNWYSTLKPGTISSSDQMSHQFVAHFVSS